MTLLDAIAFSLVNLAMLIALLTALWAVSIAIKDASIIDVFWGPACAFGAVATFLRTDGATPRALLLTGLVCLWALRLGWHLGKRNLGKGEDPRYRKMRDRQGGDRAFAFWSLFFVFWLQGLIAWAVSLPTQWGQFGDGGLGVVAFLGAGVFFVGLGFEAISDWQLSRFKADPENKGALMTEGLWAWTRHPNYFGDACVWFGLALIALAAPLGVYTIYSPFLMSYFLIFVSGKAMKEKMMAKKYPEYEDYKKRTSGFFPWPPKSTA